MGTDSDGSLLFTQVIFLVLPWFLCVFRCVDPQSRSVPLALQTTPTASSCRVFLDSTCRWGSKFPQIYPGQVFLAPLDWVLWGQISISHWFLWWRTDPRPRNGSTGASWSQRDRLSTGRQSDPDWTSCYQGARTVEAVAFAWSAIKLSGQPEPRSCYCSSQTVGSAQQSSS